MYTFSKELVTFMKIDSAKVIILIFIDNDSKY